MHTAVANVQDEQGFKIVKELMKTRKEWKIQTAAIEELAAKLDIPTNVVKERIDGLVERAVVMRSTTELEKPIPHIKVSDFIELYNVVLVEKIDTVVYAKSGKSAEEMVEGMTMNDITDFTITSGLVEED